MRNYWSCSEFADWLRGTKKDNARTLDGWQEWREEAKAAHPVRYWLAEEGLQYIQNFITWPVDKLSGLRAYVLNRWVTKTHALTSNLEKGRWYDFDTRLIHCLFDELVNYVEVEEAWSNVGWDEDARKKYKVPSRWNFIAHAKWRSPGAGLEKLEWASKLTNEEFLGEDEKHLAKPTSQALAAIEIMALYNWWKFVRPARPDPHDASGWTAICNEREASGRSLLSSEKTEEERARTRQALDKCQEIERAYEEEDAEMMIRLIKVRQSMWT